MARFSRVGIASLAMVMVCGAGCTGRTADRPGGSAPPSRPTAVSAPPAAFGTRHLSLGCLDGISPGPADPTDIDPFRTFDLTAAQPAPAEEVGVRLPAGLHWYFRKDPLTMPAGAADLTLSLTGAKQALGWVPASVWTSGGRPDLEQWAASSITFHGCPDSAALFLGGLLAADLETCLQLTLSRVGQPNRTVRKRLTGSPCAG